MKRILFLLILAAVVAYHLYQDAEFQAMLQGLNQEQVDQDKISTSKTSLGYILTEDNWIEFPLPPNIERLKLVTQASVPALLALEDATFTYALEYEIIGKEDASPIFKDIYHHTTRVSRFKDEKTDEQYTASLYIDPTLLPADGRIFTLNTRNWPSSQNAQLIRIRLAEKQEGLLDALLRVYQLERKTQPEDLSNWQRLSIYKRQRFARGNVYPHGLLSDNEKANLLNNRWRPLGPKGISGSDYQVRRLYTLKEISDTPVPVGEQEIQPDIASDRVLTVPIGEAGIGLKLTLTRVPGYEYQGDEMVEMNWFGSSITERAQKRVQMSNSFKTTVTTGLNPGLLELRTGAPYLVDFEQHEEDDWVLWQPERIYTNTYLCDEAAPLEFKLAHLGSSETPIRVTIRAPLPDTDSEQFDVTYELIGSSPQKDRLLVPALPSIYDRVFSRGESIPVTDPSVYYFHIPSAFEGIKFTASRPVLISVATRSPNLPHRIRVPEDVGSYSLSDPDRMSTWFSIRPVNHQQIYKNQRTRLVRIQQRPPTDDPDLLQGNYFYESLRPSLNWTGRNLLLPPEPDVPLRAPNPRSLYHPLNPGRSIQELLSTDMLQTIRPNLVYINEASKSSEINIFVDGNNYFSTMLFGNSGKVQLPPLPVGRHDLDVTVTPKTQILMNCLQREEPGYMLRFAPQINKESLIFKYHKTGPERDRLSFLFFSSSISETTKLKVELENSVTSVRRSPTAEFTLTNRRFEISPTETAPVTVINDGNTRLGVGRRFLFPIGDDIPPGTYRIVVSLENGPGGYLILSHVEPGIFSYRTLAKEPINMETIHEPNS